MGRVRMEAGLREDVGWVERGWKVGRKRMKGG